MKACQLLIAFQVKISFPAVLALTICLPAKFTMMISLEKTRWISGRWIEGDWISAGGWNDDKGLYAVLVPGECMTTESGSLQIRCTCSPKTTKLPTWSVWVWRLSNQVPENCLCPFPDETKAPEQKGFPHPIANKVPSTSFLCLHPLLLYMVLDQYTIERSCRC